MYKNIAKIKRKTDLNRAKIKRKTRSKSFRSGFTFYFSSVFIH